MYSELNEWKGGPKRLALEFIIFMFIYIVGFSGVETLLQNPDGTKRYGIIVDIAALTYFVAFVCFWARYRFAKFRYKTEDGMVKIYKVLGKSERLLLNVELSDIHGVEVYKSKSQYASYGPIMNYCVVNDKEKYICALEFEGKKYRFVFQPYPEFVRLITPNNTNENNGE